ncbi:hypothetical protein OIV83_002467 [Microbotryomycetes sp. JL201]|nr:hypothetical protein OIV83_002467 [Microbotryomycetes sp. JL201]
MSTDAGPLSPSGYLSESWLVPPATDWPPLGLVRRRRSASSRSDVTDASSASSSGSSQSSWDSVRQAQEDQLQWEESIRQLQLLINVVLIPFAAKWAGRKWAYWAPSEPPSSSSSSSSNSNRRTPELSQLRDSAYKLRFRSLPYSADTTNLFPERGPLVHSSSADPLFSLRCFPSPKRRPAHLPARPKSDHLLRPTPPPSLEHTVDLSNLIDPAITPQQRLDRLRTMKNRRKPYTLELTILAGKRKVHKHAVVRERCKRRLREAFRLVLVRGARTNERGEIVIETEPNDVGPKKWVVPGFSYVAVITLEMYRHPMSSLVDHVRKALASLKPVREALDLEELQLASLIALDRLRIMDETRTEATPTAQSDDIADGLTRLSLFGAEANKGAQIRHAAPPLQSGHAQRHELPAQPGSQPDTSQQASSKPSTRTQHVQQGVKTSPGGGPKLRGLEQLRRGGQESRSDVGAESSAYLKLSTVSVPQLVSARLVSTSHRQSLIEGDPSSNEESDVEISDDSNTDEDYDPVLDAATSRQKPVRTKEADTHSTGESQLSAVTANAVTRNRNKQESPILLSSAARQTALEFGRQARPLPASPQSSRPRGGTHALMSGSGSQSLAELELETVGCDRQPPSPTRRNEPRHGGSAITARSGQAVPRHRSLAIQSPGTAHPPAPIAAAPPPPAPLQLPTPSPPECFFAGAVTYRYSPPPPLPDDEHVPKSSAYSAYDPYGPFSGDFVDVPYAAEPTPSSESRDSRSASRSPLFETLDYAASDLTDASGSGGGRHWSPAETMSPSFAPSSIVPDLAGPHFNQYSSEHEWSLETVDPSQLQLPPAEQDPGSNDFLSLAGLNSFEVPDIEVDPAYAADQRSSPHQSRQNSRPTPIARPIATRNKTVPNHTVDEPTFENCFEFEPGPDNPRKGLWACKKCKDVPLAPGKKRRMAKWSGIISSPSNVKKRAWEHWYKYHGQEILTF